MVSKYFRSLLLFLGMFLQVLSFAQNNLQNLMDMIPDKEHGQTAYWIEDGDYYYFVSRQRAGSYNSTLSRWASRFFINKYDKNNLQRLDQKYIYGDTLNSDSISYVPYLSLKNDQFYLFYVSQAVQGDTLSPYYNFYQKLDINFNTLVPEKRIEDSAKINFVLGNCLGLMDNDNLFVGYHPATIPEILPII